MHPGSPSPEADSGAHAPATHPGRVKARPGLDRDGCGGAAQGGASEAGPEQAGGGAHGDEDEEEREKKVPP